MPLPEDDYLTRLGDLRYHERLATTRADQWLEAHDYRLPPSASSPLPPMTPFGSALFQTALALISRAHGDPK